MSSDSRETSLLGDTPRLAYPERLDLFNRFAARELRNVVAALGLRSGDTVLDAGCGTGLVTIMLAEQVTPGGRVVGLDLSAAHVARAREQVRRAGGLPVTLIQGSIAALPFASPSFDLIWCSNTINHVRDPLAVVKSLAACLAPRGRLALGQSAFLPDMFFAWDARLDEEVRLASYQQTRDRLGLDERDTTAARNLFGLLKRAGLRDVSARTILIERMAPLSEEDETYFLEGMFRAHWGEPLRPYLSEEDWQTLKRLCDPDSPDFCLRRPDFHHLQTYTVVTGSA